MKSSFPETDTWLSVRKREKASWHYPIIPTEGVCFKNVLLEVETPKTGVFELRVGVHGNYLSALLWGSYYSQIVWARQICFSKVFSIAAQVFSNCFEVAWQMQVILYKLLVLFYLKGSESNLNDHLFFWKRTKLWVFSMHIYHCATWEILL